MRWIVTVDYWGNCLGMGEDEDGLPALGRPEQGDTLPIEFWLCDAKENVAFEGRCGDTEPIVTLAHLDGLDLRSAADGWHGIWQADGVAHQFWLPEAVPDMAASYTVTLPMDSLLELRAHAARRFWRSLNGRAPGPDFRVLPAQLRQWHILSLRALDARLCGESYRTIAEILFGFRGTKEDFENDPRKNKARRLAAHGIRMMRGGYRLLLHYPIKPGKS